MDEAGRHHALRRGKEALTAPWRSVHLGPARSIERLSSLDGLRAGAREHSRKVASNVAIEPVHLSPP